MRVPCGSPCASAAVTEVCVPWEVMGAPAAQQLHPARRGGGGGGGRAWFRLTEISERSRRRHPGRLTVTPTDPLGGEPSEPSLHSFSTVNPALWNGVGCMSSCWEQGKVEEGARVLEDCPEGPSPALREP